MKPEEYQNLTEDDEEKDNDACCNNKYCWWRPSQNSLAVTFCNETSIHGFKFMGQGKRHLSERIFWTIGFLMSVGLAIFLIYNMLERYQRVPVIVSFQASEQDMDSIPFPAVTLCNMNKFPKSKVKELQEIAKDPKNAGYKLAKKQLVFVRNACNAQESFAKSFNYAHSRGTNNLKKNKRPQHHHHIPQSAAQPPPPTSTNDTEQELTEEDQRDLTDFLMQNTISCKNLLRLCMLGEEQWDCAKLFRPIITDYGCTFNILPLPLLLRNSANPDSPHDNPVLGSKSKKHWPEDMVANWSKWNYDDGFVLSPGTKYPWRQKRAGLPYGLSLLLDPNIDDYYCPASDSLGLRYILHTPVEMPHVMEFSSVADLEKEILIEVHPDVTNADDDIRNIDPAKRMCYFGREKTLKYFGPYTGGNCIDECVTDFLTLHCGCTLFYMPRGNGTRICDNDPASKDHHCIDDARLELQEHLKKDCGDCETLCEDIAYNYETTIADLQEPSKLWADPKPPNPIPEWANHQMSIVHIFFGADSTVPKFRKKLYGVTDLIANTGGILGLCLGFSILSGVEVLYFFTLRAFWKFCRKRVSKRKNQQEEQKTSSYLHRLLFQKQSNKVISLHPNRIPIYSNEMMGKSSWSRMRGNPGFPPPGGGHQGWGNSQGHHFYGATSIANQNTKNGNFIPGYYNY